MACCRKDATPSSTGEVDIYKLVQERYGDHAKSNSDSSTAHAAYNEKVAEAFGYSKADLESIPAEANLGVSCGNPLAKAGLKQGEVSIDLGSGAGLDVFLAAKKVGPTGRAIGIEMTDEMLALANKNAEKGGYTNTEFIQALITSIPLPDNTADCITSNCVINLVPDIEKPLVFQEIYRLLKPGGRLAVSDILAKKELSREVREDPLMYIGCISGASLVEQYHSWMKEAGFRDIVLLDTNRDLNVYKEGILSDGSTGTGTGCCAPTSGPLPSALLDYDLNEWTGAYQIYAIKPAV